MRRVACILSVILLILGVGVQSFKRVQAESATLTIPDDFSTIQRAPLVVDWWPMRGHDLSHTGYSTSTAPDTDSVIWSLTTGNWVTSSPAVVGGRVFVGSVDGRIYCLDASTGKHIWNYTTGNDVCSSPAVAGGKVYVGSHDCRVYCLNASTGAQIWNYTTGLYVFSSPAVADGRVFVGSYDGRVYCLDASTGGRVWDYTTGGVVYSSPAVVEGRVFVGSADANVYAFGARTLVVPDQYSTIQEAINNAADWDTVFVKAGTYYEHVVVNKTLSLTGENRSTTIVDGNWTGVVINVTRNGVAI